MPLRSTVDKLKTVREKNTYYFNNTLFEAYKRKYTKAFFRWGLSYLSFLTLKIYYSFIKTRYLSNYSSNKEKENIFV